MSQIKLNLILKAIEEKKGDNIEVFNTETSSPFFSNIIVATILNKRNGEAIADEIDRVCANINEPIKNIEGKNDSEWVLIDAGDILIHLFTEEERIRINIEELIKKSIRSVD